MAWYTYVMVGIIVFLGTFLVVSYYQTKKISVKLETEEFKLHMRKGQLVDVRTKSEYNTGHINGARNISIQGISREYGKLRKDQAIYLYCATGKRSSRAAIYLRSKGFTDVFELKNGLKAWDGPLK